MTMQQVDIRPLRIADMPQLSTMLETAFDASVAPYLTYSQHGIAALLALQLRHPASFDPKKFYVATLQDQLVGFAEFRLVSPEHGFLCYICVSDQQRGRGVAGRLIDRFDTDHPAVRIVDLDVFQHNTTALRLYEKLGFLYLDHNDWHRRPLPEGAGEVSIIDLMACAAAFDTYGFCRLQLHRNSLPVMVGRIGSTVLRCFDVSTFLDDDFLGSVRATFPSLREALVIVPGMGVAEDSNALVDALAVSSTMASIVSHRLRRTAILQDQSR